MEPIDPVPPPNLKDVLYTDLEREFTARLAEDAFLSTTAKEALAGLLATPAPVFADVLCALALPALTSEEVPSE